MFFHRYDVFCFIKLFTQFCRYQTLFLLYKNSFMQMKIILCFKWKAKLPASWLSGNAFVSGAWGPRLRSRAGQIGASVDNGSPPLGHFFKNSCSPGAMMQAWATRTCYTLRHSTASAIKDLVWFEKQSIFLWSFTSLENSDVSITHALVNKTTKLIFRTKINALMLNSSFVRVI